jgi:hypothetical protein
MLEREYRRKAEILAVLIAERRARGKEEELVGIKHVYTEANEIKGLLKVHGENAEAMKEEFNAYMESKGVEVGSKEYKENIDLYAKKGGLKGHLEFMGLI